MRSQTSCRCFAAQNDLGAYPPGVCTPGYYMSPLRGLKTRNINKRQRETGNLSLVPKLCLGTHFREALLRHIGHNPLSPRSKIFPPVGTGPTPQSLIITIRQTDETKTAFDARGSRRLLLSVRRSMASGFNFASGSCSENSSSRKTAGSTAKDDASRWNIVVGQSAWADCRRDLRKSWPTVWVALPLAWVRA